MTLSGARVEGNAHGAGCALLYFTLYGDGPAVELNGFLGDDHAQSCTGNGADIGRPMKGLEDMRQIGFRNANSCIAHP